MEIRSIPKKVNTAFMKSLASQYPNINLDFKRALGYSIYIKNLSTSRWMMVDIKDDPDQITPHFLIVINVKPGDFDEDGLKRLLQLPLNQKNNNKRETSF
ncbi:hypothetical protein [Salibacterium aidingense]|uniref:hypothetical protein n=1 Tax=Salibacterium aidingense TaxID=384933 RepID=UPI00040E58CA|nr:hypothetical protein [Salibacterium aidingense]